MRQPSPREVHGHAPRICRTQSLQDLLGSAASSPGQLVSSHEHGPALGQLVSSQVEAPGQLVTSNIAVPAQLVQSHKPITRLVRSGARRQLVRSRASSATQEASEVDRLQAGSELPQTNSATRALTRGKKRSLVRAMSNLSVNSDDELPKPLRTPSTSGDDGGNDDDGAGGAASSSSDARLLTFITGMKLGSQHVRPLFFCAKCELQLWAGQTPGWRHDKRGVG